jgi:hypothetical protein
MRILLGAAVFVCAALLFWVEPLATKMCLPLVGGGPSVWTTSLVFFQAALLGGYLYAHLSSRWLAPRFQALLHVVLLVAAALLLPVALGPDAAPAAGADPVLWLFAWLAGGVGAPFLLLSATAPLLQHWLARSAVRRDPYTLYAASNAGSLLGLAAFPIVLEPRLTLVRQSAAWTIGYVACVALVAVAAAAAVLWQKPAAVADRAPAPRPAAGATPFGRRLRWLALAFAPSSLLLGVTTHLTTDVASVPLLWVVPLGLYLLSFVLTFHRPAVPVAAALRLQPVLLIPVALAFLFHGNEAIRLALLAHLALFFATAVVCHGELARLRPPADELTFYYLTIAAGGVLGGMLNALAAPLLFNDVLEYPALLALAAALRPPAPLDRRSAALDILWPALVFAAAASPPLLYHQAYRELDDGVIVLTLVPLALVVYHFRQRPLRFALGVAALLLIGTVEPSQQEVLLRERNFFGVLQVVQDEDPPLRRLYHGTTEHGTQSQDPKLRTQPQSYYHPDGPLGDVFRALRRKSRTLRVAIAGLGTGAVACYGRVGETWTYYEIDPAMIAIARNPAYFTYLRDCAPTIDIVLGDARLTLARAAPQSYDLAVLDAFSSDAIPVHLLTREAFTLYLAKLRANGVIAVHISNRYLDLRPVVGNLAAALGLVGRIRDDDGDAATGRDASQWVVLARTQADLGVIAGDERWQTLPPSEAVGIWTDDYSNLLAILQH